MTDIVYITLRNLIDRSGPPPIFAGVGSTVSEALVSARLPSKDVQAWIAESDLEIRAYFSVYAYDMTTSPPTKLDPPDLKRGGGPYLGRPN